MPVFQKIYNGGRRFKFDRLGYGKFSEFINSNMRIKEAKKRADQRAHSCALPVTEDELIETINAGPRNYALQRIRDKFGNRPFNEYGYGKFDDFVNEHEL